jgi:hypothetical protein
MYDLNSKYEIYKIGSVVDIVHEDKIVVSGTIVSAGTDHVEVTCAKGMTYEVPYCMLKTRASATPIKSKEVRASNTVIKEEEKDGKKFKLIKDDANTNGKRIVQYKIMADDVKIWESEETLTNTYDEENGWSSPDDFDSSKLDLIDQKAQSGFDLMVESYSTIEENVAQDLISPEGDGEEIEPETGVPAFAPGEGPNASTNTSEDLSLSEGDMSGGGEGAIEDVLGEPASSDSESVPEAGLDANLEEQPVEASLNFRRSILTHATKKAKKKSASELLRNPQHRINPITRKLMQEKNLDSSTLNDIELADKLKDSDWEL